jgi:hypothetical protein
MMASRMREVGFQYAVAALVKKRSELAGEIGQLELTLRDRLADLARVDDVLRMLAPAKDPSQIPPKRPIRYLNIFKQGELGRIIVGLLRASDGPMTNLELANLIIERGGIDASLWTAIRRRCRANLAYLENNGRVVKIGNGANARWALSHALTKRIEV